MVPGAERQSRLVTARVLAVALVDDVMRFGTKGLIDALRLAAHTR